ncbi:DUF4278 domain-containing protein [Stenomitos frigidus]|uniref:DUF4278 domain-containing protein n=1 Tax=Stenomitos frigidus ULC18 TaxID=2107698 RepID=A0A2T1E2P5_9CYAN|nr:DUF4278 domain-containing protein [Stenomitos frigidus]PSB27013.1 hypothetical protein C7B82_17825 [Stenomitos frigidus ULC18]
MFLKYRGMPYRPSSPHTDSVQLHSGVLKAIVLNYRGSSYLSARVTGVRTAHASLAGASLTYRGVGYRY